MHDATEGGVLGGLFEIANHSRVGMEIHLDDMIMQDEVRKTCACFGINPYISISEGTLLATVHKNKAQKVVRALEKEGIPSSVVGVVTPKAKGLFIFDKNKKFKLDHPRTDPFWAKFEEYLEKRQPKKI